MNTSDSIIKITMIKPMEQKFHRLL